MVIDRLAEQIRRKKNPCIVGIDPEWSKIPECYRRGECSAAESILRWSLDVVDAVSDIVPAVKPQMAFFEVHGAEGIRVHQEVVRYAHSRGLLVVDDSKRNDIGNTARAYAYAHLAKGGPIDADFLTVSPFLGTDSIQPFADVAMRDGKGLFVLVKTSNPGSVEISEAVNPQGKKISRWLAEYVHAAGERCVGASGYSAIGAVVGATFPQEAAELRKIMSSNFFLAPGFGAQGGGAKDAVPCFNEDGLGAIVSSSRGVLYHYLNEDAYDRSVPAYQDSVRAQAARMKQEVYNELKKACPGMKY